MAAVLCGASLGHFNNTHAFGPWCESDRGTCRGRAWQEGIEHLSSQFLDEEGIEEEEYLIEVEGLDLKEHLQALEMQIKMRGVELYQYNWSSFAISKSSRIHRGDKRSRTN